jgi:hypothetical protein
MEVKGIGDLVKNLQKAQKNIGKKVTNGLLLAGHHLMRESAKIVPVQIGHMKASQFVRKKTPTHIEIGYEGKKGAKGKGGTYFAYVHEIPNPPHAHGKEFNIKHAAEITAAAGTPRGTAAGGMFNRGPNQQYKFLEKPIKDEHLVVLKTIRDEVTKTKI